MSWLIPISGIFNFLLGLIVWLRKPKDPLHYSFFTFVMSTVLSIGLDFIFRFYPTLLVLRSAYTAASLIPLTLLVFILKFCEIPFDTFSFWRKLLFSAPTLIIFILCFIDGFIVQNIYELTVLGYRGQLGPLFTLYSLYYFVYLVVIVFVLYRKYNVSNYKEKVQILFASVGILLYAISATMFSLVFPVHFGVFDFTLLDAPSLIFFVALMAYTILKLGLFSIKVIATEILVFSLWIIVLTQIILSSSLIESLVSSGLLLAMVSAGILLIRSVIKEVQLREMVEKQEKELEKANEEQAGLIHFISHEIKGFLTKSRNIFSFIRDEDYGPTPEYLKTAVKEGLESDEKGVQMVQEILSAANLKKGTIQYKMEVCDIKSELLKVVEDLRKNAENKGLSLDVKIEEGKTFQSTVDCEQMKHVFKNLIDNSIKYTPTGGLHVSLSEKDSKILLTIKDTGVGITEEDKKRLFTEGGNGKNSLKVNVESTGYGLYIAKKIVEAHKGRIWVESEGQDKGTTFYVELPKK